MKNSYCFIFAIFLIFFITQSVVAVEYRYAKNGFKYAYHAHSESSYQHAWCSAHKGIEEYENKDKTRVDCLTSCHAVEFDVANKWADSIGQALHQFYPSRNLLSKLSFFRILFQKSGMPWHMTIL